MFRTFTTKGVADATRATEVLTALSCNSRAQVDAMADAALRHGGAPDREPQDHGWMYSRGFHDPDGHVW